MSKLIKKYQNANQGKIGYRIVRDQNGNFVYVKDTNSLTNSNSSESINRAVSVSGESRPQVQLRYNVTHPKTRGELRAEENEQRRQKEHNRRVTHGYGTSAYYEDKNKEKEEKEKAQFNTSLPGHIVNGIHNASGIASMLVPGYGIGYGGGQDLYGALTNNSNLQNEGRQHVQASLFPTSLFLTAGTSLATPTQMLFGYNFGKDAYKDIKENGLNFMNGSVLAGSAIPFLDLLQELLIMLYIQLED